MKLRRPTDQRIFFHWERGRGLRRRLGLGRARPVLLVLLLLGFVLWVGARERERAGVRQTRATLLHVRQAVDAYVADHDGECPPNLAAVAIYGNLSEPPKDAWGRPIRLICPAREEGKRYELMSDGPDGEPGGLDRIQ
jgi:general secretion pathway protein G